MAKRFHRYKELQKQYGRKLLLDSSAYEARNAYGPIPIKHAKIGINGAIKVTIAITPIPIPKVSVIIKTT